MTSNAVVANETIGGRRRTKHELSDFSTDKRVLVLSLIGLGIGAVSALVASALVWLIALITNLTFYHRFSADPAATPVGHHLGYFVVLPCGPPGFLRGRWQGGPPKTTRNGRFPAGFAHFRAISAVLVGQNGRFRAVPDGSFRDFVNKSALSAQRSGFFFHILGSRLRICIVGGASGRGPAGETGARRPGAGRGAGSPRLLLASVERARAFRLFAPVTQSALVLAGTGGGMRRLAVRAVASEVTSGPSTGSGPATDAGRGGWLTETRS